MKADNELYRQLRELPPQRLWTEEVPKFDRLSPKERNQQVALVRAVGVVFSTSRNPEMKAAVKAWMVGLLQDPNEKIRRYATAAIPKLGGDESSEKKLLTILRTTQVEREKRKVAAALEKIGGAETLKVVAGSGEKLVSEQKIRASVARQENPGTIRLDAVLPKQTGLKLHLRCRAGLESIVADEIREAEARQGKFRVVEARGTCVVVEPKGPFSLADLYRFRCFDTASFVLGLVRSPRSPAAIGELARLIAAPLTEFLMKSLTDGALRYRLNLLPEGNHQAAIAQVTSEAFRLNSRILNDAREAPWSVDVFLAPAAALAELRPKVSPDPRLTYRKGAINAASHPPLAACLARLAGRQANEVVWDPFCGSGLELIETSLLGGVKEVVGTDLSEKAIGIARDNWAAAGIDGVKATFLAGDFRGYADVPTLASGRLSLIISNPPLGRRVRVPNLHGLFADLFRAAAETLRPGGRLIFVNPLRLEPTDKSLRREYRQVVDLGGYDCRVEMYVKS